MDFEKGQDPVSLEVTFGGNENGSITLGDKDTYRSFIIDYTLIRDALVEEGQLRVLNDGTNIQVIRTEQDTGDCGVTFSANISGNDARLGWVTTAGNDVTMNYILHKVRN